jgi:hypothetical protein
MTEHPGYDRHEAAGRDGGNSCKDSGQDGVDHARIKCLSC